MPQHAAEILGHERVIAQLWDALRRDVLHHAYLFEGPDGLGKRKVAVRLAMAANCDHGSPCGKCRTCTDIAAGVHPDVLWLAPDPEDKTATIKVEAVREVVTRVGYHRYAARRRFVLVDPAEALHDSAANALLKTLEEPPAGTGFVLIAHHAEALLPTIVSRCQRIRFTPVSEEALASWLGARGVADSATVARIAQGCPGRALSLGKGAVEKRVALRDEVLGVLEGDLGAVFAYAQKVGSGGERQAVDARVGRVLDLLEELLRDATVLGARAQTSLLHADARDVVERWTRRTWPDGVARCTAVLEEARDQLELNVSGRTVLEAVLASFRAELAPPGDRSLTADR